MDATLTGLKLGARKKLQENMADVFIIGEGLAGSVLGRYLLSKGGSSVILEWPDQPDASSFVLRGQRIVDGQSRTASTESVRTCVSACTGSEVRRQIPVEESPDSVLATEAGEIEFN